MRGSGTSGGQSHGGLFPRESETERERALRGRVIVTGKAEKPVSGRKATPPAEAEGGDSAHPPLCTPDRSAHWARHCAATVTVTVTRP